MADASAAGAHPLASPSQFLTSNSKLTTPASTPGIDYELLLDCVHCGLCTSACPTYVELGTEADSPRGRIYLMRAVTDGTLELNADVRGHLDLCLNCRACESACPSGVQYGKLIEPFRVWMTKTQPAAGTLSWLQRLVLFHIAPYRNRLKLALTPARWMQRLGVDRWLDRIGLTRWLPRGLRLMHELLPRLETAPGRLPELLPAEGKCRARVALFTGCASDGFFPRTTWNTARVLQRNGCEVWIPRSQGCCGAALYHMGQEIPAQDFAVANCLAFEEQLDRFDAIIVNAAGCGAMLKDYGHLLHSTAAEVDGKRFARKVRDVSEFLVELGPVRPEHPLPVRAVYHDACHLCHGQQIRKPPRQLLEMIPGLELISLNESEICCGAAGPYNLTQPDMAERLGQRKARNILDAQPDLVLAGNVVCLLQIGKHLRMERPDLRVLHPVDVLWASYSGNSI